MNSIELLFEEFSKKYSELINALADGPDGLTDLVQGVQKFTDSLGAELVREALETVDREIRELPGRKKIWDIAGTRQRSILTGLGPVIFTKTLYRKRDRSEYCFLLDRFLDLDPNERMTEEAEARILEEASQTSYQKGGRSVRNACISRQTVKEKVHGLKFPAGKAPAEKKTVRFLYIDADEDHDSLQFQEKKGDLEKDSSGMKKNSAICKLVYVYEGVENVSEKDGRHRLVNPHYFCGTYRGTDGNRKLWDEVYSYIDSHYDLGNIERIFLNSDGGSWILAGAGYIAGLECVIDEFHLQKYLTKMVWHMGDSAADVRSELLAAVREDDREKFSGTARTLKEYENANGDKIDACANYILSNWEAARTRIQRQPEIMGCSAEGHVSHMLAGRMSSRPMGWSWTGLDNVARLRAYLKNGGSALELVRYTREQERLEREQNGLGKAAGAEDETVLSMREVLRSEGKDRGNLGHYADYFSHTLALETGKNSSLRFKFLGLL